MFDIFNRLKSYQIIVLIIFLWLLIVAMINPEGNFPLGDDWAYAKPVKTYLETGTIKLTDWASMTLIMQIFFGIIATKIFGFSFTVLRFLTLLFGAAGSIGTYFFLKENSFKNSTSLLITLLVIFSPVYLLYSYCFMTDIPFFAFMIWSLLFITKFFRNDNPLHFFLSLILILFALLIRDLAVIFPFAFALAFFFKKGNTRKKILYITLSMVIIFGTYYIYNYWLSSVNGVPKSMERSHNLILNLWKSGVIHIFSNFIKNSLLSLIFTGFNFFPALILLFYPRFIEKSKNSKLLFLSSTCLAVIISLLFLSNSPEQNIKVNDFMFNTILHGYFTWMDVNLPSGEYMPVIPSFITYSSIIIGIIGGIILINLLFEKIKYVIGKLKSKNENTNTSILLFNFTFLFIYLIIVFSHNFYNRYLILLFPLVFVMIKSNLKSNPTPLFITGDGENNRVRKSKQAGRGWMGLVLLLNVILILWISYFSVASAHDWLSFNRARWQGADYLMKELKISPANIDGGFEFNGWFTFDYNYAYTKHTGKNWWWVVDNTYYIGWGKSPYYEVIKEISYNRWYPPCFEAKMIVQKRK